jgi:predicted nucleic acid-binding protein
VILADTSVWIDHLNHPDPILTTLLRSGKIATHPFVVTEVALGSMRDRRAKLAALDVLLHVNVAEHHEVRRFIESHSHYSKGLGLTDVHLIASCLMTVGVQLWTREKALANVATALGISARLP